MFSIMATGATIEIKPFAKGTEDFVASKFFMKDGTIWSSNPCFGTFPRDEMTEQTFTEHINRMITEGFQIVVHQ